MEGVVPFVEGLFHFFSFHLNAGLRKVFFLSLSCLANCAPGTDGDYANAIEVPRAIALIDGGGDVGRHEGLLTPRRAVTLRTLPGQPWIAS